MKLRLFLLFSLLCLSLNAQETIEEIHSVYFDFDRFDMKEKQSNAMIRFIKKIDTIKVETIEIFGYCDDRGSDSYNFVLSNNRANTVKNILLSKGIKNKIIISIEGRGRVLLDEDLSQNIPEERSKNRRVDVVINFKKEVVEELQIPGIYTNITRSTIVGDRIYLEHVLFERGSSQLTYRAKKELDKIARQLQKYRSVEFEIQGHVCCTPYYHTEAIDRKTKRRELSKNRAMAVFKYLDYRRVSLSRMSYKGYGNTQPLGKGSKFDRRVEFLIKKI